MLLVQVLLPFHCPWSQFLRSRGLRSSIVRCVPNQGTGGVTALVKVRSEGGGTEDMAQIVSSANGVVSAKFLKSFDGSSLIGLVKTSRCMCALSGLPLRKVVGVSEDERGVRVRVLLDETSELNDLIREVSARGFRPSIEEVVQLREGEAMPRLKPRQEQLLLAALELGYHEFQKRVGTRELAELFGVSPRAVSEVLRRAHKRLVESALMT
jgi:predicted DNA binding protein